MPKALAVEEVAPSIILQMKTPLRLLDLKYGLTLANHVIWKLRLKEKKSANRSYFYKSMP